MPIRAMPTSTAAAAAALEVIPGSKYQQIARIDVVVDIFN
jgi:hypothetical protein